MFRTFWRRQPGLVVAVGFGAANAVLAAIRLGGRWAAVAGLVTMVLVGLGYLVADRFVPSRRRSRSQQTAEQPAEHRQPPPSRAAAPVAHEPPVAPAEHKRIAVVFVHGILSDASTWESFTRLIRDDPDLSAFDLKTFEYDTRLLQPRPHQRIPDLGVIAHRLDTQFRIWAGGYEAVVIVSHSMGGLVAQQFIARMLSHGKGEQLTRIKRVVMFACPTLGSEFLGTLRRLAPFRHNQEEMLRVLNQVVTDLQQTILTNVVHATEVSNLTCPIPLRLFAGDTDNIVRPASALGVYPEQCTGVVTGDHFSIIKPGSPQHESYQVLKHELTSLLTELDGDRDEAGSGR